MNPVREIGARLGSVARSTTRDDVLDRLEDRVGSLIVATDENDRLGEHLARRVGDLEATILAILESTRPERSGPEHSGVDEQPGADEQAERSE